MKMVWHAPPLTMWIPFVILLIIFLAFIVGYIIWKRCYKWKVSPDMKLKNRKSKSSESVYTMNDTEGTYISKSLAGDAYGSLNRMDMAQRDDVPGSETKENSANLSFNKETESPRKIAEEDSVDGKLNQEKDFELDRTLLEWSSPSLPDPKKAGVDQSLPHEVEDMIHRVMQQKINKAAKIVRTLDFSLPENASEEQKENNRRAFHKMVWIVANDENMLQKAC